MKKLSIIISIFINFINNKLTLLSYGNIDLIIYWLNYLFDI